MTLQQAQDILCGGAILVLILIMFACLIRAIRGPEIADRIVSVNMLGTLTIMVICILSFWLKENYLLDVQAHFVQDRTFAIVENGSWSPAAAKAMQDIIQNMKPNNVEGPVVTIKSAMKQEQMQELEKLADNLLN